jgi:nucleoside-diphosphate-sugar epimerase
MSRVCVLGAAGFVGKNLLRDTDWTGVTRQELDLTDPEAVKEYFKKHEYDVVIHCAVVGGSRLRPDDGEVFYKNLLMFENVAVAFKGKLIYFSSGAALRGNPPSDPYGMSKWLIDRRIETLPNAHSLRIWGCYGPGEPSTRFSAVCKKEGHVVINKDRYFDFIDIEDVRKIVWEYVRIENTRKDKEYDLVYPEKLLLSQWAEKFGATWEIEDTSELGESYIKKR